jgi:hypothetical protein
LVLAVKLKRQQLKKALVAGAHWLGSLEQLVENVFITAIRRSATPWIARTPNGTGMAAASYAAE